MNVIRLLDQMLGRAERFLLWVSVAAMLVIAAIICAAIVLRAMYLPGIPDDTIIVRQLMVVAITFALGVATADRAHIAIDMFHRLFPARLRFACDILALVTGLVALAPLCYWAYCEFRIALESGDYLYGKLQLPVWPGEAVFFIGLLLVVARLLLLLATTIADGLSPLADQPAGTH